MGNHPGQSKTVEKLEKVQAGESVLNLDEWKAFLENAGKKLDVVLAKEENERTLFSTLPDTEGKKAVIKRAIQLTEYHWTPLRDIATFTKNTGKTMFRKGERIKGVIYASVESIINLYVKTLALKPLCRLLKTLTVFYIQRIWEVIGIVCNGLVRYSLDIRRRFSTARWLTVPGMKKVFDRGYYIVKHIKSGDENEFCVYEPEVHVEAKNGFVTVKADSCEENSVISHMDFRTKDRGITYEKAPTTYYNRVATLFHTIVELSDEEKKTGVITRRISEGAGSIKIYFKNKYGVWTHEKINV